MSRFRATASEVVHERCWAIVEVGSAAEAEATALRLLAGVVADGATGGRMSRLFRIALAEERRDLWTAEVHVEAGSREEAEAAALAHADEGELEWEHARFLNGPERVVEETLELVVGPAEETLARLPAGRTG